MKGGEANMQWSTALTKRLNIMGLIASVGIIDWIRKRSARNQVKPKTGTSSQMLLKPKRNSAWVEPVVSYAGQVKAD